MKTEIKALLIKLFLFLLPLCLLFIYVEYRSRMIPNSYKLKKTLIEEQADSIRILVLGSSNAYKDIDPANFSCPGFNFGNSAQTLFYDSRLGLKYLDRLPQIKGVIITLSYISFFFELNELPDSWRDYFYLHYYEIRDPSLPLFDPKAFCYTALYSRKVILKNLFHSLDTKKEIGDIQSSGWERAPLTDDPGIISDSNGYKRVKFHESLLNPSNFVPNIQCLNELIIELKKRDIKVYLVTPPVYETYYKWVDTGMDRKNRETIEALCRKFDIGYFDYFRDPRFMKGDFYDNDHLNYLGAKKFSLILDQDIVSQICKNN